MEPNRNDRTRTCDLQLAAPRFAAQCGEHRR